MGPPKMSAAIPIVLSSAPGSGCCGAAGCRTAGTAAATPQGTPLSGNSSPGTASAATVACGRAHSHLVNGVGMSGPLRDCLWQRIGREQPPCAEPDVASKSKRQVQIRGAVLTWDRRLPGAGCRAAPPSRSWRSVRWLALPDAAAPAQAGPGFWLTACGRSQSPGMCKGYRLCKGRWP